MKKKNKRPEKGQDNTRFIPGVAEFVSSNEVAGMMPTPPRSRGEWEAYWRLLPMETKEAENKKEEE